MNGPRNYPVKPSQSERQIPFDITYMENLKYDTNAPIYETGKDSQENSDCQGEETGRKTWTGSWRSLDLVKRPGASTARF